MTPLRVALVGARRVRQGLGPFVARYLREQGVHIVGVVGSSHETSIAAARELGGSPAAYTDLEPLVREQRPHAIGILCPHPQHERYLRSALDLGLHALVEKPFIFGGAALEARAQELVAGFRQRGLLLVENCQWPEVLPAYLELFPAARGAVPRRFAMQLAPASSDPESMLADCLSHPLSLLQALVPDPDPKLLEPRFAFEPGAALGEAGTGTASGACLRLACGYLAGEHRVDVAIELMHTDRLPRPAGFGIDGAFAHREVREPNYAIYLTSGARSVKVPDPLEALIRRFVQALHEVLSGRTPADPAPVLARMRMLEQAARALAALGPSE